MSSNAKTNEVQNHIYSLETEPIFSIHIDFADGSNPIVYYNLSLARALDVLKEWCENWILAPDKDCKLNDSIWMWHAHARNKEKVDYFDLTSQEDEDADEEDESEPILEDSLNPEE